MHREQRCAWIRLSLTLILITAMAGCGGGAEAPPPEDPPAGDPPPGDSPPEGQSSALVLVANQQSSDVSVFEINDSGRLSPSGAPVPTGQRPADIAGSAGSKLVFVADEEGSSIIVYRAEDGELRQTEEEPLADSAPVALAVHTSGNYLYAGSDDGLHEFNIAASAGTISPMRDRPLGGPSNALVVHPTGKYAYATHIQVGPSECPQLNGYEINSGGELIPHNNGSVGFGANCDLPRDVVVTASGEWLVVGFVHLFAETSPVNGDPFEVLAIAADGSLTVPEGAEVEKGDAGGEAAALAAHPTQEFVYSVSRLSHQLFGFRISEQGELLPLAGFPVSTGTTPRGMAFDPSGEFLLVANHGSNNVSVFRVDPSTGAATPVEGSPFPAGTGPVAVTSFEE
jgi:hypothetical protein